jgi:seryl-tRNA synthetase
VRAALARRGADAGLDRVLELDALRRELIPQTEAIRAEQNTASKAIGAAKQRGEDVSAAIAAMEEVAARGRALSDELSRVEAELNAALAELPNLADEDAPPEDTVLREVGEAGRTGRDHLELAGSMIDMEAAARVSGSRFAYLKGDLVLLEFALVRWALDKVRGHGFEPVVPPVLVREPALYGTGFLPDTEQQIYRLADDDLYLVGTSEVSLASLHAGEVIDEAALPLRYAGFSTCFRREAGAAGKDTRGIFRVHQFDKLEMFSFVRPGDSPGEHDRLLAIEEELLGDLGVPYRVVNIAVDDLGASAAKKYDLEAWLPGQERYRELTSTSNTTDFQARRLNIRWRPEGGKPEILHTLSATTVRWRSRRFWWSTARPKPSDLPRKLRATWRPRADRMTASGGPGAPGSSSASSPRPCSRWALRWPSSWRTTTTTAVRPPRPRRPRAPRRSRRP